MKNYYEILGLNPDAPHSAVKPAAQAKANEINEAFRILNDPEQRKAYDAWLVSYSGNSSSPQSNNFQADTVATQKETHYANKNAEPQKASSSSTSFVTAPSMRSSSKSSATATMVIKPFMRGFLERFTYIEVSSFRDVVIFVAALAFFLYMLLSFLGPTPIPPPPENSPLTLSQQRG